MKRLIKEQADQICEFEYGECDCGYHFAVDATFLDGVNDFEFECPSCGAVVDTAELFPEDD